MQVSASQLEGVVEGGVQNIKPIEEELDLTTPSPRLPPRSLTVYIPGANTTTNENFVEVSNVLSPELTPGCSDQLTPVFLSNSIYSNQQNNQINSLLDHPIRDNPVRERANSLPISECMYSPISPHTPAAISTINNYSSGGLSSGSVFFPSHKGNVAINDDTNIISEPSCILERSIQQINCSESLNGENLRTLSDNCRSSPETDLIKTELLQVRYVNSTSQAKLGLNQVRF